jgi:hypothetical protein
MTATDTTTEILNDLVAINNDRIEGYERAMKYRWVAAALNPAPQPVERSIGHGWM